MRCAPKRKREHKKLILRNCGVGNSFVSFAMGTGKWGGGGGEDGGGGGGKREKVQLKKIPISESPGGEKRGGGV